MQSVSLPKNTVKQLLSRESVDIVVGIPSYNCAHTVNYVIYQTARGLAEFFPDRLAVIMVSDGGSSDGTLSTVKALRLPWKTDIIPTEYVGVAGKGSALRAIFETVVYLDAKAVIVVDSDLRSITPEWVERLLLPTLTGTGLVTPLYTRHKYDGTITNFLCYPYTRALYGQKVRQPIGGDFGLSRELVERLLRSRLWETPYVPRFGIDIFETHSALGEGFTLKQAYLGSKVHESKDPSKHLASMFHEVAGSMYSCTKQYETMWRNVKGSKPVEVIKGNIPQIFPEEVQVDSEKLLESYTAGYNALKNIYKQVLSPELFRDLEGLHPYKENHFTFPVECWVKCVYSFAAYFPKQLDMKKRHSCLEALRILWLGKVASFVLETTESDASEAEKKIEEEACIFEELKPYLLEKYQI